MADNQTDRVYSVLFLCTGNSARSILAEALMNAVPGGSFRAISAGSHPKGEVHPLALHTLKEMDLPTEGYRSKSWDEFATPDAPNLDFVFTVCDNASGETCPFWPGQPMTANWGVDDPAAVEGSEIDKVTAFRNASNYLRRRIEAFAALPLATIDRMALQNKLTEIGKLDGAADKAQESSAQ